MKRLRYEGLKLRTSVAVKAAAVEKVKYPGGMG